VCQYLKLSHTPNRAIMFNYARILVGYHYAPNNAGIIHQGLSLRQLST